jgi:hypothetical protein
MKAAQARTVALCAVTALIAAITHAGWLEMWPGYSLLCQLSCLMLAQPWHGLDDAQLLPAVGHMPAAGTMFDIGIDNVKLHHAPLLNRPCLSLHSQPTLCYES